MTTLNDQEIVERRKVWIAMVEVVPKSGNVFLPDAAGAYVNILALARSQQEYRIAIKKALNEFGLELVSLEDVEEFQSRISINSPNEEIMRLASEVSQTNNVKFGIFHSYKDIL